MAFFQSAEEAPQDGGGHDDDGDRSEADSDYLELQADIAKLEANRQAFLREQLGVEENDGHDIPSSRGRGRGGRGSRSGRGSRGGHRGRGRPRGRNKASKALSPPPHVKMDLSRASELITQERYEEALPILTEVIRNNAETYDAWPLLVTIYTEFGDRASVLGARYFMATLNPTNVDGWLAAADYALAGDIDVGMDVEMDVEAAERARIRRYEDLETAKQLYSGALRADRTNVFARIGRANISLELGHPSRAAADYLFALQTRPYDLRVIRNLAEASYDTAKKEEITRSTIDAYQKAMVHAMAGGALDDDASFTWVDAIIYPELFAALGQYGDAIGALKTTARWMLGRHNDLLWSGFREDDREWDVDDRRRAELAQFDPHQYPTGSYGLGLPLDLRAKLAVYRLKEGHEEEALVGTLEGPPWVMLADEMGQEHLSFMDLDNPETPNALRSVPHVVKEVANELCEAGRAEFALRYLDLYHGLNREIDYIDAEGLVLQGKCHLALGDEPSAEECFLAALEAEEDNIDARYQLALQYEKAQEKEQALIMISEALSLGEQRGAGGPAVDGNAAQGVEGGAGGGAGGDYHYVVDGRGKLIRKPRTHQRRGDGVRAIKPRPGPPLRMRRTFARRLGANFDRREFESRMSKRLKDKYNLCQNLKQGLVDGDQEAIQEWMAAAKELTDDFRSFREFYPWDKYLNLIGYGSYAYNTPAKRKLKDMAERLREKMAPAEKEAQQRLDRVEHRGIPFNDWLDLFLEYAIGLVHFNKVKEAYSVCISARDSIVYQAKDNMFLIHLTWATCALHAGDEETCVAVARYFMRNDPCPDAFRIFAALCRAVQAPSSWYTSGPAQKFMLRQIAAMDKHLLQPGKRDVPAVGPATTALRHPERLDAALLVMYGQMLFASTSYSFSLNYFHRAASIEPDNPYVNLCVGLAYVHWALKRQAKNRQYMLGQGLVYIFRYYERRLATATTRAQRQEAHYNAARTYHLVQLHPLAAEYYLKVLDEQRESRGGPREDTMELDGHEGPGGDGQGEDFVVEAAYNLRTYYLFSGDAQKALDITRRWLTLE